MKLAIELKNSIALSLLLGLSVITGLSQALPVSGLYNHEVAVGNESDSERDRAFSEALSAVIVKVTGARHWLEEPVIATALRNAQNYVEGFDYRTEIVVADLEEVSDDQAQPQTEPQTQPQTQVTVSTVEQNFINVIFASDLVDDLLASANVPVWDSNRPSVLVWMVLQNDQGERALLTEDISAEVLSTMRQFAEERGLPIIFPVLDFEDRRNLDADTVWTLDEEAISLASVRYGADSILAGRLHFTTSGELVGLWQFIFQDEVEIFDGLDTELTSYLFQPLDRITSQLANHFAIVRTDIGKQRVRVRVEGIKNLTAYTALLSYVQNLGLVVRVSTALLDGESLELELSLSGDSEQLNELIALDRDLLPLSSSLAASQSVLHYRWTR